MKTLKSAVEKQLLIEPRQLSVIMDKGFFFIPVEYVHIWQYTSNGYGHNRTKADAFKSLKQDVPSQFWRSFADCKPEGT